MKLYILDLKTLSSDTFDELIFGKLSLTLFAITIAGKIIQFEIKINNFDYFIDLKGIYELTSPIVKIEADPFFSDLIYVAHE